MKYVVPTIELANIETKDILASSVEKYEVEKKNDGSGNVIMNALDIFR